MILLATSHNRTINYIRIPSAFAAQLRNVGGVDFSANQERGTWSTFNGITFCDDEEEGLGRRSIKTAFLFIVMGGNVGQDMLIASRPGLFMWTRIGIPLAD